MANEVVEKATEVAPNIEQKLVEMLDSLQNGAVKVGEQVVKYSPDVADAALWVVRIDGIQAMIYGVVFLVAIFPAYKVLIKLYGWAKAGEWEEENIFGLCFGGLPLASFIVVSGIAVYQTLLNVWTYIAVFVPKLWLAKQIIKSVIN